MCGPNVCTCMLHAPKLVHLLYLCQEEDQPKEKRPSSAESEHPQTASTSTLKAVCKQKHTESLQSISRTHLSPCTGRGSGTRFATTQVAFVDRDAGAQKGKEKKTTVPP